jgi:hypothetical protein
MSTPPTRIIKAGAAYFGLVFGAGFVLGSVRVPFLVPRLGERLAELIEMPFMFVVILVAARFITRRFSLPADVSARLGAGLVALGMLVTVELSLAVLLQNRPLGEYVASRDPVSGSVYLAMLALFAMMPLILARFPSTADTGARPHIPPTVRPQHAPTKNLQLSTCRVAACREEMADGKEWSIYLLSDHDSPVDVTLERVSYEWGDSGHSEAPATRFHLPAHSHCLLWREGSEGSEMNMEFRVQVKSGASHATLIYELGKLYRKRDPARIDELGKPGWLQLPT